MPEVQQLQATVKGQSRQSRQSRQVTGSNSRHSDFAYLDKQREKYCVEPQFTGGPNAYHYVPAKCVANRKTGARSSNSGSSAGRNSSQMSDAPVAVKIARLRAEVDALKALANSLEAELMAGDGKITAGDKATIEAVYLSNIPGLLKAFKEHMKKKAAARFASVLPSAVKVNVSLTPTQVLFVHRRSSVLMAGHANGIIEIIQ